MGVLIHISHTIHSSNVSVYTVHVPHVHEHFMKTHCISITYRYPYCLILSLSTAPTSDLLGTGYVCNLRSIPVLSLTYVSHASHLSMYTVYSIDSHKSKSVVNPLHRLTQKQVHNHSTSLHHNPWVYSYQCTSTIHNTKPTIYQSELTIVRGVARGGLRGLKPPLCPRSATYSV